MPVTDLKYADTVDSFTGFSQVDADKFIGVNGVTTLYSDPVSVTVSGFNFNLPENALIYKIEVYNKTRSPANGNSYTIEVSAQMGTGAQSLMNYTYSDAADTFEQSRLGNEGMFGIASSVNPQDIDDLKITVKSLSIQTSLAFQTGPSNAGSIGVRVFYDIAEHPATLRNKITIGSKLTRLLPTNTPNSYPDAPTTWQTNGEDLKGLAIRKDYRTVTHPDPTIDPDPTARRQYVYFEYDTLSTQLYTDETQNNTFFKGVTFKVAVGAPASSFSKPLKGHYFTATNYNFFNSNGDPTIIPENTDVEFFNAFPGNASPQGGGIIDPGSIFITVSENSFGISYEYFRTHRLKILAILF